MILPTEVIVDVVLDYFDLGRWVLKGDRHRGYVDVRQIIAYFCKQYTKMSLREIGLLSDQDHSTIIYSINQVKNHIEVNKDYAYQIEDIERILASKCDKEPVYEIYQENDYYEIL
jgi:chromosomal replication initiation ATPase DnaA